MDYLKKNIIKIITLHSGIALSAKNKCHTIYLKVSPKVSLIMKPNILNGICVEHAIIMCCLHKTY